MCVRGRVDLNPNTTPGFQISFGSLIQENAKRMDIFREGTYILAKLITL